jgi:hypothetical protein
MKSIIFIDVYFENLIKRMESVLEGLIGRGDQIISTTISPTHTDKYWGVIFHQPRLEPQKPATAVTKLIPFPVPGGCVSVPSLAEQMESILEPRPWDHAPIAVNQMGRD